MSITRTTALAAVLLLAATAGHARQAPTTIEELWEIVQRQQAEIDELRVALGEAREAVAAANDRIVETEARVDATGDFVETLAVADSGAQKTTIGGYGELHYNNVSSDAGDSKEIDFHRFVLFFGHEFTDRVRFFSEFELEHSLSGDGAPGEVELEQAFVEYALTDNTYAKTGLFLLPLGILNETHEPTTFFGVERNNVESIIIPSTWWEAGVGMNGRLGSGFSWDASMHSGLAMPTSGSSQFRVRGGRQKVAEAIANDWAYTARLKYTGVRGLELAASYQYQADPSQVPGDGLDTGQLFTAHAIFQRGIVGLRALYAGWNFDGFAVEAAGADSQAGWYVEPSLRFTDNWGVFARYEDLDAARDQDKFTESGVGLNYWPVPGVVLKMDYRTRDHTLPALAVRDFDAFSLGFGYSF